MKIAAEYEGRVCYIIGFVGDYSAVCLFEEGELDVVEVYELKVTDPDYLDFDDSGKN